MKSAKETPEEIIARLSAQSAEKDAEIERLLKSISEKTARIEELETKKKNLEDLRKNTLKKLRK